MRIDNKRRQESSSNIINLINLIVSLTIDLSIAGSSNAPILLPLSSHFMHNTPVPHNKLVIYQDHPPHDCGTSFTNPVSTPSGHQPARRRSFQRSGSTDARKTGARPCFSIRRRILAAARLFIHLPSFLATWISPASRTTAISAHLQTSFYSLTRHWCTAAKYCASCLAICCQLSNPPLLQPYNFLGPFPARSPQPLDADCGLTCCLVSSARGLLQSSRICPPGASPRPPKCQPFACPVEILTFARRPFPTASGPKLHTRIEFWN